MSHEPEPTDALERLAVLNRKIASFEVDRSMFGEILDSLPFGLIMVDESGRVLFANRQTEILFGYHRSKLVGESVHMLIPPPLVFKHAGHIERFFASPSARPMHGFRPLTARHANGRDIQVQIQLGPLVLEAGVFVLAIIRRADADAAQ